MFLPVWVGIVSGSRFTANLALQRSLLRLSLQAVASRLLTLEALIVVAFLDIQHQTIRTQHSTPPTNNKRNTATTNEADATNTHTHTLSLPISHTPRTHKIENNTNKRNHICHVHSWLHARCRFLVWLQWRCCVCHACFYVVFVFVVDLVSVAILLGQRGSVFRLQRLPMSTWRELSIIITSSEHWNSTSARVAVSWA